MAVSDRFFEEQPTAQVDPRSPLIQAIAKARGRTPNACPFGCKAADLDTHGYCNHLIGWTIPGDERHFNPRKKRESNNVHSHEYVDGSDLRDTLPTDVLEKGTVSCRVYRNTVATNDPGDEQPEKPKTPVKKKPTTSPKGKKTEAPAADTQLANAP